MPPHGSPTELERRRRQRFNSSSGTCPCTSSPSDWMSIVGPSGGRSARILAKVRRTSPPGPSQEAGPSLAPGSSGARARHREGTGGGRLCDRTLDVPPHRAVCDAHFGVTYHADHIAGCSGRGLTPQRPQWTAKEGDDRRVCLWVHIEPAQEKLHRLRSYRVCLEETGFLMAHVLRRTWGLREVTPTLCIQVRTHEEASGIGALIVSPGRRRIAQNDGLAAGPNGLSGPPGGFTSPEPVLQRQTGAPVFPPTAFSRAGRHADAEARCCTSTHLGVPGPRALRIHHPVRLVDGLVDWCMMNRIGERRSGRSSRLPAVKWYGFPRRYLALAKRVRTNGRPNTF